MDRDTLKEVLSMEFVAEELQIPIKKEGGQIYCLCPWHDDHNFGSCHIWKNRIICMACGKTGDIFNVIQQVRNCGFKEALRIAAEMIGESPTYQSNWVYNAISRDDIRFLEICNERIRELSEITSIADPDTDHLIDEETGDNIVFSTNKGNPLAQLYKEEPEEYKKLINYFVYKKEQKLTFVLNLMIERFGEMGYTAVIPSFYRLRDIQRKIDTEVTINIPEFKTPV